MIKEIREELDQLGEESYKQFNQKLIPGTDHVIGVRMPALRKLAKGIAKTDSKQYLEEAQTEKGQKMTGVQHDKRNQRRVRSTWGREL